MEEDRKFLNGVWMKVQLIQFEEDEKQKVFEKNKKIRKGYVKNTLSICMLFITIFLFYHFCGLDHLGIYGLELVFIFELFYAVAWELNLIDEYK